MKLFQVWIQPAQDTAMYPDPERLEGEADTLAEAEAMAKRCTDRGWCYARIVADARQAEALRRVRIGAIQAIQLASSGQPVAMHPAQVANVRGLALEHLAKALEAPGDATPDKSDGGT